MHAHALHTAALSLFADRMPSSTFPSANTHSLVPHLNKTHTRMFTSTNATVLQSGPRHDCREQRQSHIQVFYAHSNRSRFAVNSTVRQATTKSVAVAISQNHQAIKTKSSRLSAIRIFTVCFPYQNRVAKSCVSNAVTCYPLLN